MKSKFIFIIAVAALSSQASFGAFLGVTLGMRLAYQDTSMSCISTGMVTIGMNLTGEIKDGRLVSGLLSAPDPLKKTQLTAQELEGIELKQDSLGDYYITKLPLSARLVNYILFTNAGLSGGLVGCVPTQPLASMSPYGTTYTFAPAPSVTYMSNLVRFHGDRRDGTPYAMKMGFYQTQMDQ